MYFLKLEFTRCETEQPLRDMESQEKKVQKDKHTGNLFGKKLHVEGTC